MFLKVALLIFLFCFSLFSKTLVVDSPRQKYELKLQDKGIFLSGRLTELSMIQNKCNETIIQEFKSKIHHLMRSKPLNKTKEKGSFELVFDGKKYFENPSSRVGRNLLRIPNEFQRMKLEDKFLCEKKSKKTKKPQ